MALKKFYIACLLLTGLLFTSYSEVKCQAKQPEGDLLVSTDWLEENLSDSLLVILHYGMKTEFKEGHIPGARLISIWDILEKNDHGLRHELPDEKKLKRVLRSWGINNHSKIIISYQDGNAIPMAARLFYTLDYAGLSHRVSILNGGFKAWEEEGRAVSEEVKEFSNGNVDIRIQDHVRISRDEVLAVLHNEDVTIIDARPEERYYGTEEDSNSRRQGHIPGAVNFPFFEVTMEDSTHMFKTREELNLLFQDHKVSESSSIITYCGSGIWASPIYFTAKFLGYQVRFYDGSFQEWGNDDSLPLE